MSDHNNHISQEGENVKRAIAESLEQAYVPQQQHHDDWNERTDFTDVKLIGYICDDGEVIQGDLLRQKPGKIFVYFSTDLDAEHCGNKYDWISIPNARLCPPPKKKPKNISFKTNKKAMNTEVTEPFEPQHPVTYDEAVDMLFNIHCCFGLYDKQWRTAVYMNKWDHEKRLLVRFKPDTKNELDSNIFLTIKDFPVNYIILDDNKRFTVSERVLRDMSNVPKENIDRWVKEKTERRKKDSIQRKQQQCKILVAGFIKDQEKKQQIARSFPGLQRIIAHYCCLLIYGLPTIFNFNGYDWSKRTDFTGVKSIGYLCGDGEVIQGDILRRMTDQIFVHFTTYSEHYGKNYGWILIPNERICPPKNRHIVTK